MQFKPPYDRNRGRSLVGAAALGAALFGAVAVASQAAQPFDYVTLPSTIRVIPPAEAVPVGAWKTWHLTGSREVRPPAPPRERSVQFMTEITELMQLQAQRSPITAPTIHYWNSVPVTQR